MSVPFKLHLCFVLVGLYLKLRVVFCLYVRFVLSQSRLTGGEGKASSVPFKWKY